ncbi:hypothetical protein B0H10DRAFT_2071096 [Mycena sp. CBHHK59/15]|nr:hypothetical protein B0H10DRAFT_2071096 [Mycena sp. CBHHK59/15]
MTATDHEGSPSRAKQPPMLTQVGRRKRQRVFTPDDRATHRVVEKQRREALNTQFIHLARLLPGLATTRRLSKSIIVSESITHTRKQRTQRLAAAQTLRAVLAEREALLGEVNTLRAQLGLAGPRELAARIDEGALELLTVEQEVFGAFPAGFGDNGEDAGDVDDEMGMGGDEEERRERRCRRSTSRSMSSNASHSPARSPAAPAGLGLRVSPTPTAQAEASPVVPSPTISTAPAPEYVDAAFLAMLSAVSGPAAEVPASFGFPPSSHHLHPPYTGQKPFELDLGAFGGAGDFSFPLVAGGAQGAAGGDEWGRYAEAAGALFDTQLGIATDGGLGFPVRAGSGSGLGYPGAFPAAHVGTHGGFAM